MSSPETTLRPPRVLAHSVQVDCGGGAAMSAPLGRLEWELRYGDPTLVRFTAASVVASYAYLIAECTKAEAWRRLKLLRAAMPTESADA